MLQSAYSTLDSMRQVQLTYNQSTSLGQQCERQRPRENTKGKVDGRRVKEERGGGYVLKIYKLNVKNTFDDN